MSKKNQNSSALTEQVSSPLRLVIANRGEIARRILKACREKNICAAVITTPEDKNSLVCRLADDIIEVDSFLNAKQIVEKAKEWGADLLHPGYGFLSENSYFAKLCENNNIAFIGPTSEQIKILGSKESSKKIAKLCNVPVLASLSSHELKNVPVNNWESELKNLGIFPPYLIKASGGGGGRGMRVVQKFHDIPDALARASSEALQAFNDDTVFIERYLKHPRHIEIQVFGDGKGVGVFFGERECSLQRRHQKVIEECPSSIMTSDLREQMGKASLAIVQHTKYRGAGTVEFLFDDQNRFYFLEMNTRLQVEHPVTELVYGIDLVHAQIDLALGKWREAWVPWVPMSSSGMTTNGSQVEPGMTMSSHGMTRMTMQPQGVALEARILAENPRENFLPTPGKIEEYIEPQGEGIRVDSGVTKGSVILPTFDSMIAKLIVHAPTRALAVEKLKNALKNYFIFGITTNIPFLISLVSTKEFLNGEESTHYIEEHLTELNQKLIPQKLFDFLQSFNCRETLFQKYPHFLQKNNSEQNNNFSQYSEQNKDFIVNTANITPSYIFSKQKFFNQNESYSEFDLFNLKFFPFINSRNQMELNIEGEVLHLENPGYYNQTFTHTDNSNCEIKSPMAGKIYDICVSTNEEIKKGDLLFILESMKMQLEIRAPQNGIVTNICVTKGEILLGANKLCQVSASASN